MEFSITLVVTTASLADAFRHRFEQLPRATVVESRWEDLPPHDCFVTAGNACDISETDNVYRATRAALLCIYHHNRLSACPLRSIVLPAFGAGFGNVPAEEVARQMAVAWQLFLEAPYPPDWDRVVRLERIITYDGDQRRVRT